MLKTVGNPSTRYGDQTIIDGNLVIGTAGKGIDFSVNSAAPGVSTELLNDYEAGSFTPIYTTSGTTFASVTYSAQTGRYTKIGNMVYISIYLWSNNIDATGASGNVVIGGLPFAIEGVNGSTFYVGYANFWSVNTPRGATGNAGSAVLNLTYTPTATGAIAFTQISDMGLIGPDKNGIFISGCYRTT